MGTTQIALARKLGITPKTLRKHTRRSSDNPMGSFPYAPKTTPRATPETQQQAFDFVMNSRIEKAARGSDARWNIAKKKVCWIDHSPVSMSGKINRTHDVQWRTTEQLIMHGIAPSSNLRKAERIIWLSLACAGKAEPFTQGNDFCLTFDRHPSTNSSRVFKVIERTHRQVRETIEKLIDTFSTNRHKCSALV